MVIIYAICNLKTKLCYIGSTSEKDVRMELKNIQQKYDQFVANKNAEYLEVFQVFKKGTVAIYDLYSFTCADTDEAQRVEMWYRSRLHCVNKIEPQIQCTLKEIRDRINSDGFLYVQNYESLENMFNRKFEITNNVEDTVCVQSVYWSLPCDKKNIVQMLNNWSIKKQKTNTGEVFVGITKNSNKTPSEEDLKHIHVINTSPKAPLQTIPDNLFEITHNTDDYILVSEFNTFPNHLTIKKTVL